MKVARAELEQQQRRIKLLEQSLQEKEKQRQRNMDELTKGISFYRERLGLEFQRIGENRLRIVFKYIDPKNPEREFAFSVAVDKNDCYSLIDCTPPLGNLSAEITALNRTNNFSQFVRGIRQKFKASLSAPQV